jgi:hypothetical protein
MRVLYIVYFTYKCHQQGQKINLGIIMPNKWPINNRLNIC